MRQANIAEEVKLSFKENTIRFIGVHGFAPYIPMSDSLKEICEFDDLVRKYGVRYLLFTSDTWTSVKEKQYNECAANYARNFNDELVLFLIKRAASGFLMGISHILCLTYPVT